MGIDTGISAFDRATTIQAAVQAHASSADIIKPGHIFGLIAKPNGVLERPGHTEAGCDFTRIAGLQPSATIVEILNQDGTMARAPQLAVFARKHKLKLGTIRDLITYRKIHGV